MPIASMHVLANPDIDMVGDDGQAQVEDDLQDAVCSAQPPDVILVLTWSAFSRLIPSRQYANQIISEADTSTCAAVSAMSQHQLRAPGRVCLQ